MIVCICRRISDRSLRAQIDGGARTAADIFRANGCAPQCGTCIASIKDLIAQAQCNPPRDERSLSVAAE